jgi:hypothetical protein
LPFAARGHDAGLAQVGKMARDLRLALAQDLDKVADADLAAGHQVEQAQAGVSASAAKRLARLTGLEQQPMKIYCIWFDKYDGV